MAGDYEERLETAIVALNRLKIKSKHDMDRVRRLNDLQKELEEEAGVKAVELDDTYNVG